MSVSSRFDFDIELSSQALGPNVPQRIGRLLWAPMLLMAVMAFPVGLALGVARSNLVASGGDPVLIAALGHLGPAATFVGFTSVFAAISFAIARILGVLRQGGGEVQESLGLTVRTLRLPATAKAFIALMMLGLMVEIAQFIGYAYIASVPASADYAAFSTWLGPLREFGLGALLAGIVLALATIARALGFQFERITQIITSGR